MEKQTIKQNNISYLLIFFILVLVNTITVLGYDYFLKKNDRNIIILENIAILNSKIKELTDIVEISNSQVKISDRFDSKLISEFGSDNEFLHKIAKLKKQIIKRKLEGTIVKLESEKLARNKTNTDEKYARKHKKQSASSVFEIMIINATTKKAVIGVGENIISVNIGDNIKGFAVKDIDENQVTMENPDGDIEILSLSYLTKKIYNRDKEKDDKNNK
jgi:hypothetical protein